MFAITISEKGGETKRLLRDAKRANCRFPLIILNGFADPLIDEQAVAAEDERDSAGPAGQPL